MTKATGTVDLNEARSLPTALDVGLSSVERSGSHTIEVKVTVDDVDAENVREYQSFSAGSSFVPLILVLLFASTTQMVSKVKMFMY